ncbi:MAG: hypothetical protein ACK587_13095, partial [Cyanobacteriota bacterium]
MSQPIYNNMATRFAIAPPDRERPKDANKKSHHRGGFQDQKGKFLSWHRAIFARCCHLTIVAA